MPTTSESSPGPQAEDIPRGPVVFVAVVAAVIGFAGGYVVADRVWVGRVAKLQEAYRTSLENQRAAVALLAAQERAAKDRSAPPQP